MALINRRDLLRSASASAALLATTGIRLFADDTKTKADSLPMQLYKSLSDEQRSKVCLPVNHPRRQYVSNWWYIRPEFRIPSTFDADQQMLIQNIFDSLHSRDFEDAINKQVLADQYGREKNAPAVAFFGTPEDKDFEFLYTGHHVTRRCNAHTDTGQGFGGGPVFYGHFAKEFNETKEHPGNPYWYQGKLFNRFVKSLDDKQQAQGLVANDPRREQPDTVIKKQESGWPGLACRGLTDDQKKLMLKTIGEMLAMFREDDVKATLKSIQDREMLNDLHISWYEGKYDIGSDQVWDTWQIEGPEMVWYFRGQPHIHCYFHLKT